jgi:hypothetical protein
MTPTSWRSLSVLDARLVVISAHFLWVRPTTASHVRSTLTRLQGTLNKNTRPAMVLCHEHDGPLMAQRAIALSWTDVDSHRMMTAPRCYAIWYARPWGDTSTSTTAAVNHTIIPKFYISMRGWSQTPTKRRTGSHTAFTGAAWVSLS